MLFNKPKPKRSSLHVKKGDKVVVTAGHVRGAARGAQGRRRQPPRSRGGVNLRWKYQLAEPQGRVQMEHPIDVSNVLLFSEKLGKGTRTKIELVDGKKVRVGVRCGTKFD